MNKLLSGALLSLVLVGCGSGSTPNPGPAPLNVTGNWAGPVTFQGQTSSTPTRLQLVQVSGSDDITGTATFGVDQETVTGRLSTGVLIFQDAQQNTAATLTGTFTETTYTGDIVTGQGTGTFGFGKRQAAASAGTTLKAP